MMRSYSNADEFTSTVTPISIIRSRGLFIRSVLLFHGRAFSQCLTLVQRSPDP